MLQAARLPEGAGQHPTAPPLACRRHIGRARDWLKQARAACATAPPAAAKAAEWLLDNDYQIHRAIGQIEQDLPASFYRRIARFSDGDVPRIFAAAHALLAKSRLQLSRGNAVEFLDGLQCSPGLTIAELWAFATVLRLACIEIIADGLSRLLPGLAPPFAVSAHARALALDDSERVSRAIANLSIIGSIRWDNVFEAVSRVEACLSTDPAGVHARADFETRDASRRAVEQIASWAALAEIEVAEAAIAAAREASPASVVSHVGYWLVDDGRAELERRLGARVPRREGLARFGFRHARALYAAALALTGAALLLVPILILLATPGPGPAAILACFAAAILPASVIANTLVQWLVTLLVPPRVLPKLDFDKGIAADCQTLVAMPVLLRSVEDAEAALRMLEAHWLASPDPAVRFALLSDFADATDSELPGDAAIRAVLDSGVARMNARAGETRFLLLHRHRRHNPAENCWMGWERKRGKLEQLNRLILSGEAGDFDLGAGTAHALRSVRYVLVADADTRVPQGSVSRLVGTIAHPLNAADVDVGGGRPRRGYSIIQPRVEISPESSSGTMLARLFTGDTAIDIYSRAVSDVYQDLFGEGVFVGKGIYDVAAFEASVAGLIRENEVLSHDLLESVLGRCGLATDIVVYEGFPATYRGYLRRLHRWIRGDWQLLPFLGRRTHGRLDLLARWKIVDNLRRSLFSPGLLVYLLAGWLLLPSNVLLWTVLGLLTPGAHIFTDLVTGLARGRRRGVMIGLGGQLVDQAGRVFLLIACLPIEAVAGAHAIAVTLWRLLVSRRRLLEWMPAGHDGSSDARGVRAWTGAGPLVGAAALAATALLRPGVLPAAAPLALLWIAAPLVLVRLQRTRDDPRDITPEPEDRAFLMKLARRTWLYFETFAGPEDGWLAPDNFQEPPHEEIAHRTSPTNIGMYLVAALTAHDLGFIARPELAARLEAAFDRMDQLAGYRGHLFNWYDTRTGEALEPRYVSTVDSGNLAAALFALAAGCRDAAGEANDLPRLVDGTRATAELTAAAFAAGCPQAATLVGAIVDNLARIQSGGADLVETVAKVRNVDVARLEGVLLNAGGHEEPGAGFRDGLVWFECLRRAINTIVQLTSAPADEDIAHRLEVLADRAQALAEAMEFAPLYDRERRLFHIGYDVSADRFDPHYYDLLASEARLASFVAIAKSEIPLRHWPTLGRPMRRIDRQVGLLSWNGSMFEYLMPSLFMRPGRGTLLATSEEAAVLAQRRHALRHDIPWGVSESAYAERDQHFRYRYKAFGVPALGLRRDLDEDLVVAPYASALALAVDPRTALANLRTLDAAGCGGLYGLFEAVDYTPARLRHDGGPEPVRAYMAHHQGMVIAAIGNLLTGNLLVRRLISDPRMRAADLLLNERVPRELPSEVERPERPPTPVQPREHRAEPYSWPAPPSRDRPELHLLGNGRLASWVSESGAGALVWRDQAVSPFAPDATLEPDGLWLYLQDTEGGAVWSATRQPTGHAPDEYAATFRPHAVEFHRRDNGISVTTEVAVAPSDDLEVRRIVLTNETARLRTLLLTSYLEPVLAPAAEHERHPAFSRLFIEAETLADGAGVLVRRRARSPEARHPVLLQRLIADSPAIVLRAPGASREAFIGRAGSTADPIGLGPAARFDRFPLDAAITLSAEIRLEPFAKQQIALTTIVAASRTGAFDIAARFATPAALDWLIEDARAAAIREAATLELDPDSLPLLERLASRLLHPDGGLRAPAGERAAHPPRQSRLWSLGISGDLPILLLRRADGGDDARRLARQLVVAQRYWRHRGLKVDLVLLHDSGASYLAPQRDAIVSLLAELGAADAVGRAGGIHLVAADQVGGEAVAILVATARVILTGEDGSLGQQLAAADVPRIDVSRFEPAVAAPVARGGRISDGSMTGFSDDARRFHFTLAPGESTPAPWANVIGNPEFGTVVDETGGGFSWFENSGEFRLTRWTNDPVCARTGEMIYLRDEETGRVWTPGAFAPAAPVTVEHGAGTSWFRQCADEIDCEMSIAVAPEDPVKIVTLTLRNMRDAPRRLTATCYAEWVLGGLPSAARSQVVTDYDPALHLLLARSDWNADFAGRTAFLTADMPPHGVTGDRLEFLGRHADMRAPAALSRWGLSNRVDANDDPCAAYQVHLELAPGEQRTVRFLLGAGLDLSAARTIARVWKAQPAAALLPAVARHWDERLSAVEVETPDPGFNRLINRWLLHQCYASRILARGGFYQAGGAIGFRDQLQDMLAVLHVEPDRVRDHILDCCAHQFQEGDVLHWWHPGSDRGVRTRCSDDLLWLPYVVTRYVRATGDRELLRVPVAFLAAPPLGEREEARFEQFSSGGEPGSVYEHCVRALDRGLTAGPHGLPLMGAGDWNDGMDRIGAKGRGESIWLAWFAAVAADDFARLSAELGRTTHSAAFAAAARRLVAAGEAAGWDGAWYRRAFRDDGQPVGAADDTVCRIDVIAQAWAVLAGAGEARARQAIASAEAELVDPQAGLVRLLAPSFDGQVADIGYIAAYPPGVRENGGQYTHGAVWLGFAHAARGDGDAAWRIFRLLDPAARAAAGAGRYRLEPYVLAADIYAEPPYAGRGGWSWYTGSAAWMWRLGAEAILGLCPEADGYRLAPVLPREWGGYRARLRRGGATIDLDVSDPRHLGRGALVVSRDGTPQPDGLLRFPDPGEVCRYTVAIG